MIPIKFPPNQVILRKNSKPNEVYFILKGHVLNSTSKRVFSTGSLIGETDIFYDKRDRLEEFVSLNKVFTLKLSLYYLEHIFS